MQALDIKNWNEICQDTLNRMRRHVEPFLSPISKVINEDEGQTQGSASYFESNGNKFLITNDHVVIHNLTYPITHSFFKDENESILRLVNPFSCITNPIDIAISKIEDYVWNMSDHNGEAIPISRFATSHNPIEHELLFFAGFSGERSKFIFNNLINRGTPYLTQECPFPQSVDEADPKFHIAIHYKPDFAENMEDSAYLPKPSGFSGSLLWDTKRVACLQQNREWSPDLAQVTGIVWGWPSSSACILATKVEHFHLQKLIELSNGIAITTS